MAATKVATLTLTKPSHTPHCSIFVKGGEFDPSAVSPFRIDGALADHELVHTLSDGYVAHITASSPAKLVGDLDVTMDDADPPDGPRTIFKNTGDALLRAVSPAQQTKYRPGKLIPVPTKYRSKPLTLAFTGGGAPSIVIDPSSSTSLFAGTSVNRLHKWQTMTLDGKTLGVHSWWTEHAYEDHAKLTLAICSTGERHYFGTATLTGDQWSPEVPMGACDSQNNLLIKAHTSDHTIQPNGWLLFHLIVGPGHLSYESDGWGSVKDKWLEGGFGVNNLPVASLDHVPGLAATMLSRRQAAEASLLAATPDPNYPGSSTPENFLYPGRGSRGFGATGGQDRYKEDGALQAATGNYDSWIENTIKTIRVGSRQPGFRLDAGDGLPLSAHQLVLDNGGALPYTIFNNRVTGAKPSGVYDWWDQKTGACDYEDTLGEDPSVGGGWDAHDGQHLDRFAGTFTISGVLGNEPWAWWALQCQGELNVWAYFDGPGGSIVPYGSPKNYGTDWGRGEGGTATSVVTMHTRQQEARWESWMTVYVDHLKDAQLPTGMLAVKEETSKVTNGNPFGHQLDEACMRVPPVHSIIASSSRVGDVRAGRANECIELGTGLRAAWGTLGWVDVIPMLQQLAAGMEKWAWARSDGQPSGVLYMNGPLDRYPVSYEDDPQPWDDNLVVPQDAIDMWNDVDENAGPNGDPHRSAHILSIGWDSGQATSLATLGYCGQAADLATAKQYLLNQGPYSQLRPSENISSLLAFFQIYVP